MAFTHAVRQDATHLLFTAVVRIILQMPGANCGNNDPVLDVKNDNDKIKTIIDFSIIDSHP